MTLKPSVASCSNDHPSPQSSSEECAKCARDRGCAACFEELVRRFQSPLLHFLIRRAGSRHDAEDLLQDTFLLAHRKLSSYRSAWRFSTWLFTIAYRLAIVHLRRRRLRTILRIGDVAEPSADANPLFEVQESERHSQLWDTVAKHLSASAFAAIWLTYVQRMSADEIGQVLNRSANGVRILLHRSRTRLAERMDSDWKPGGDL